MIFAVNHSQCLITGGNVIHNNPKSHNIRQLFKRGVFLLHFAPNGIRRLFSAGHRSLYAVFFHVFLQTGNNLRYQIAALLT